MSEINLRGLTPFKTIWFAPRATIRVIVSEDAELYGARLIAISAILEAIFRLANRGMGDDLSPLLLLGISFTVAPITGIIGWNLISRLYAKVGSWLGGSAEDYAVRAAMAWSTVPLLPNAFVLIIEIGVLGQEFFHSTSPTLASNTGLWFLFLGLDVISIILAIWSYIIFFKALSEIFGFSTWRALATVLLSYLFLALVLLLIVFPCISFFSGW